MNELENNNKNKDKNYEKNHEELIDKKNYKCNDQTSEKDNNNSFNFSNKNIENLTEDDLERLSNIKITEHLSDEFKKNLAKKMQEEYEKNESFSTENDNNYDTLLNNKMIKKSKTKCKTHSLVKRLAIAFSCFIIISSVTFGKNFTSLVGHLFSNQDKSVDVAIENGYYQNIDMDYIVHDGVGIKIDYLYSDDTCIYIAFNILSEEEFDVVGLYSFSVKGDDNIIYDTNSINELVLYEEQLKRLNNKNAIIVTKLYLLDNNYSKYNSLQIDISRLSLENNSVQKSLINEWNFKINTDEHFKKDKVLYAIDNESLLDNYKISLENNKLFITLFFTNKEMISYNRNDIYLEDDNGNVFYCNDLFNYASNRITVSFSLSNNNYNNLKLSLKLRDNEKRIVFYLKKDSQI